MMAASSHKGGKRPQRRSDFERETAVPHSIDAFPIVLTSAEVEAVTVELSFAAPARGNKHLVSALKKLQKVKGDDQ